MPVDEDLSAAARRGPGRRRIAAVVALGLLFAGLLSAQRGATVYTDYLWFDSLGVSEVWTSLLKTKLTLGVVFTLVFFVVMYANLAIADRSRHVLPAQSANDELLDRLRELLGPRRRSVRIAVALLTAVVSGAGASGLWNQWILARHGADFGVADPQFGRDVGFYVFRLPFLVSVTDWAFASLIVVAVFTVVNHYVNGGIRLQSPSPSITRAAAAHLSVLVGLLSAVRAVEYWLSRYELTTETRGAVDGIGYTGVNATLPALSLLSLVAVSVAVVFFANARAQRWRVPMLAVGVWVVVSLVAGVAYPAFVQRYRVETKESEREEPYLAHNIAATRAALGLSNVEDKRFDYSEDLDIESLKADPAALGNVRLLDPSVMLASFRALASKLDYYRFDDIDVDRYEIDGRPQQVLIGVRELNQQSQANRSWEAQHLVYTHGYGVAMAPVGTTTAAGSPDFLLGDVPLEKVDGVEIATPEIYHGEGLSDYAIVGTSRAEENPSNRTSYKGSGGVRIGGFARQLAFALRFGQSDPLLSEFVENDSRVLFRRDIKERVSALAPFLAFDSDPYPVVLDERIVYVIDGYTTTDRYPYGTPIDPSWMAAEADLANREGANYVRNSVKAVVDAYEGDVKFYLTDDLAKGSAEDPIVRAYASAFPDLFTASSEMPTELTNHLRYPEDLFRIQTSVYARFQLEDPIEFYERADAWSVAQQPSNDPVARSVTSATGARQYDPVAPYYQQMKLPDEEASDFLLFRPYVPYSSSDASERINLTSFIVAKSDPDEYGRLVVYRMTEPDSDDPARSVPGPLTVDGRIRNNSSISESITLLGQSGSEVVLGNLLILPIGSSLLYLRPFYVRSSQDNSPPELKFVVASNGSKAVSGETLAEALDKLSSEGNSSDDSAGEDQAPDEPDNPKTTVPASATAEDLLAEADRLFGEADAALRDGGADGLAEYQDKMAEVQRLLEQLGPLLESSGST